MTDTTEEEARSVPAKAVRDDPALESFGMMVVNGDKAVNVDLTRSGGLKMRMAKAGEGLIEMALDEKQADELEEFIAIRRPRSQASRAADYWRIATLVCGIGATGTGLAILGDRPDLGVWVMVFSVAAFVTGELWRMVLKRS